MVLPEEAVQNDAEGVFVWRLGEGDRAERVDVEVGAREDRRVVIRAGIRAGDRIVAAGTHKVRAGQPVSAVALAADGAPAAHPAPAGAVPGAGAGGRGGGGGAGQRVAVGRDRSRGGGSRGGAIVELGACGHRRSGGGIVAGSRGGGGARGPGAGAERRAPGGGERRVRLPELCIERPVLATVFSLLIVLFGLVAAPRLPNRELPNVDPPVVSVVTVYPGAAAEVVETSVTEPLEELLIGIEGIDHLTSVSREQVSSITVQFEISRNVDVAANDVRDRVARAARGELPEDVEDPVIAKRDSDASPVLWMALRGGRDPVELTHIAETQVRDFLSKLPGVASVFLAGERRMAMRVWIDNERLTSYGLIVADVADALGRENVDLPSGRIEGAEREFTVRTLGELATAEAFEQLIVTNAGREPIRLRDLGRVEVGPESERKLVRFDGLPGVGLGVVKLARANTIAVVDAVLAATEELNAQLPKDVHLRVAFDRSEHIRESIGDVLKTLAEAVVLVLAVIYVFLRTLRATLNPRGGHPHLGDRHPRRALLRRLLDQHLDPDGSHPGDRPRGGRRHHRPREHRPLGGGGDPAHGGRAPRHARDLLRRPGGDDLGDLGLLAALLSDRHDRAPVSGVRHHRGRRGGHLGLRGPDHRAHAVRAHPHPPPSANAA